MKTCTIYNCLFWLFFWLETFFLNSKWFLKYIKLMWPITSYHFYVDTVGSSQDVRKDRAVLPAVQQSYTRRICSRVLRVHSDQSLVGTVQDDTVSDAHGSLCLYTGDGIRRTRATHASHHHALSLSHSRHDDVIHQSARQETISVSR